MSRPRLWMLHGYTMTGAQLRAHVGPLHDRLSERFELAYPDAPHRVPRPDVERLYDVWLGPDRARWPTHDDHRTWWDARDDGRFYDGWEASVEALAGIGGCALGFSQGAMMAALLAAMGRVERVVLVGGRTVRAEALRPLFAEPVRAPSLHVRGEADTLAFATSAELMAAFDPASRRERVWPGGHQVPREGAAADAIVEWLTG